MSYDHTKDQYTGTVTRDAPAGKVLAITPSDDDELEIYAKSLMIFVPSGTTDPEIALFATGDRSDSNGPVTIPLPEGLTILPIRVRKVMETGTHADISIFSLYD
jgi:hypothetical protein